MTRVKIPVRIQPPVVEEGALVAEAAPPVVDVAAQPAEPSASPPAPAQPASGNAREEKELAEWRDRALRLQAEMENFRRRQQRLADERVTAERERLLRDFLRVTDDLKRALDSGADAASLRQGVDLTLQSMTRLLEQEGAKPIQAAGEPFDPAWHEAVSSLPHEQVGLEPDTVAEVVSAGYRLGDRLLRPARVVVAV